ncbi:MAG: hypothetical protein U0V74_01530 [Chitinophagales bacterium]
MKKLVFTSVILLLLVSACKKDAEINNDLTTPQSSLTEKTPIQGEEQITLTEDKALKCWSTPQYCGTATTVMLMGNQLQPGTVTVANDAHYLYVTYNTQSSWWQLYKIHLYVGDCSAIPVNSQGCGNVNQFTKKLTFCGYYLPKKYTITIPLSSLPQCFCIAAEAVVAKKSGCNWTTQTVWGQGTSFNGQANSGMHFNYCKQSCQGPPPPPPGEGCGYRAPYWFNGFNSWPVAQVTIAGYTYTQAEGFALGTYQNTVAYSPALFVLFQDASIRLSGNSVGAEAPIWDDVAVIEAWLSGKGELTVSNLPSPPADVLAAASTIEAWLDVNDCDK